MIKFNLYEINRDYTWSFLATANDFNKHFSTASISADLGAPSQLRLSINTTAGKIYDILAGDKDFNIGIEVVQDEVSMAFVNSRQPRIDENNGIITLVLNGASYLLKHSRVDIQDNKTVRSLNETLQSACNAVIATPFSQDVTISLDLGALNNLEIVEEAISKSGGYTWRDNGLKRITPDTFKPEIIYGDFANIEQDNTNNKTKIYKNNIRSLPNVDGEVRIDAIRVNYSGEILSHIEPVLTSTNSGTNKLSLFTLNQRSIGIIKRFGRYDYDYPIVEENGKYYVFNSKYSNVLNRYETYPVQESVTEESNFGIVSIDTAHLKLYIAALNRHRNNKEIVSYSPSVIYRKLIYPGNKIKVRYNNTVKLNNGTKTVMDIDDTFTLRALTIDLLKL